MLLIIIGLCAWLMLAHAARLGVNAIAVAYGVILALRVRCTEQAILASASTRDRFMAEFDRKPTRGQRRATRKSLTLALQQTEFRSLFPDIAHRAQRMVSGSAWKKTSSGVHHLPSETAGWGQAMRYGTDPVAMISVCPKYDATGSSVARIRHPRPRQAT
ncbi:hypothetical protein SPAN111604_05295 [Sphingomonas antarctica]